MTASVQFYNVWREAIGEVDLSAATLKLTLHSSAYVLAPTHSVYADLSGQLGTANGYTSGGATLANTSWIESGGVGLYRADNVVWNVSGSALTARRAVLRAVGTYAGRVDPLILSILLDSTPADVTTQPGSPLTIAWDTRKVFTVS